MGAWTAVVRTSVRTPFLGFEAGRRRREVNGGHLPMTEENQQASHNLVGLLPKAERVLSKPIRRARATPALDVLGSGVTDAVVGSGF